MLLPANTLTLVRCFLCPEVKGSIHCAGTEVRQLFHGWNLLVCWFFVNLRYKPNLHMENNEFNTYLSAEAY